jgi:tetratricopeptide (TPR) repeat protein
MKRAKNSTPQNISSIILNFLPPAKTTPSLSFVKPTEIIQPTPLISEKTLSEDVASFKVAIKSAFVSGDFNTAEKLVAETRALSLLEEAEMNVERAKLGIFKQSPDEALYWTEFALAEPSLSIPSRMTSHSVRGHALIMKGEFEEAKRDLEQALELSELFPNADSGTSVLALLVWVHSELQEWDAAANALLLLQVKTEAIRHEEHWLPRLLVLIRTEARYHRALKRTEDYRLDLEEAVLLGKWLGIYETTMRSEKELRILPKMISTRVPVYQFSDWIFLPRRELVLSNHSKEIVRLDQHPVVKSVLCALAEGPKTSEELYQAVWKNPYHVERHEIHLMSCLDHIRKMLPKNSVQIEDQTISLK